MSTPNPQSELPRFDLAFTMAGAISAGAYTAGVFDFLIEALDAWTDARGQGDPLAPQHDVQIRAVTGASAGAIVGAILGACLGHQFKPRRLGDSGDGSDNPLFDAWVNRVHAHGLLQTRDLADGQPVRSLLDSTSLLEVAQRAIDSGQGRPARARSYLANPLRFVFTLTNLRGVPYPWRMAGSNYTQTMVRHADQIRFCLGGTGGVTVPVPRGGGYALNYPAGWSTGHWARFAQSALASGAYPLGLAPRELERDASDYDCLPVAVPGGPGQSDRVCDLRPDSAGLCRPGSNSYNFVSVDGGTTNNEPVALARLELADGDVLARHETAGVRVHEAVVMVDPFVGPQEPGPASLQGTSLISNALSTFAALKDQSRFCPEDIVRADDSGDYGSFLIAPVRQDHLSKDTATSLASGALGGFSGFLDRSFREHDFQLGRRNAQMFLMTALTLPENNPLFARWTDEQRKRLGRSVTRADGSTAIELPIIPLMPSLHSINNAAAIEPQPEWPLNRFDPASLDGPIRSRLDGVVKSSLAASELNWFVRLGARLGWFFARGRVSAAAVRTMRRLLTGHGLLS
ncbi:MAG: hypothetical protein RIQ60_313 [Pseudomonadota bacterium]|jgi:predicted acylesterase/phospholipase RssA